MRILALVVIAFAATTALAAFARAGEQPNSSQPAIIIASGTKGETPPPPLPAPPTATREADKAATFQRYAKAFEVDNEMPKTKSPEALCRGFLKDLSDLNGIEFVEPIMRATRFSDPGLADLRKNCNRLPLTRELFPIINFADKPDPRDVLMDETGDPRGIAYYWSANFRVYSVPIFNSEPPPISAPFYVFYSERACRTYSRANCLPSASYRVVLQQPETPGFCRTFLEAQFPEPYSVERGDVKEGDNAIIKYRDMYLFLGANIQSKYNIGTLWLQSGYLVDKSKAKPPSVDRHRVACSYKLKNSLEP